MPSVFDAGAQTQGSMHAGQELYQLNYLLSPKTYFEEGRDH